MKERKCFLTKEQSLVWRGIAIILVIASHYAEWYADVLTNETFRYALTRLGVYGVNIFFLASGYGLVKSVTRKRIGGQFLWNRLKNTYLPYLLIAGIIELYAGGIHSGRAWFAWLTGYDYWFIRNILIFYFAFFVIYRLTDLGWLRMVLLAAVLFSYSWWLVSQGRNSFWYISNISFMIGILLAHYEKKLLKAAGFFYPAQLLLLAAGLCWVVKSGLEGRLAPVELSDKIKNGVLACAIWSLFCAQAAPLTARFFGFLQPVGKLSLEIYLLHMFIFYRVVNTYTDLNHILQGIAALALTAAAAWLINLLFTLLWKAADALNGGRRA